jgi:glycosyltransferase involved in cell wall biosynthesis
MISALILTFNEASDLPGCIQSLEGCSDIHVFDSVSTDDTIRIAESMGARVCQRTFDGYASQRNAALETCDFQHSWILVLDADERLPEGMFRHLTDAVAAAEGHVAGFRMRRRDFFEGRWLRHAQLTPSYIRLFRKGAARYHREINEVVEIDGTVMSLPYHFEHYPFSKGLAHWLERHIRYARKEAERWHLEQTRGIPFSMIKAIFSPDPQQRRYHQKGLFYRLPCRPWLKWCYMMFVRCAFLDGRPGMRYAWLQTVYESWIVSFAREQNRRSDHRI